MKLLTALLLAISSLVLISADKSPDWEQAKRQARQENKLILLTFSGSDWCLPCIRMEKEVFEKDTFSHFANNNLVMVKADFPRQKKNIDKENTAQNEALAEQYDKAGHFPFTVLLNADGKVLMAWDGYQGNKPEDFIRDIKAIKGGN
jgi:thioredoxin-related protein